MQEQGTRATQILLPGQQLPAVREIPPLPVYLDPKPVFIYQFRWRLPAFMVRFITWYIKWMVIGEERWHQADWRILQPGEALSEQRRGK